MTVLTLAKEIRDCKFDVVFVHGLNGTARETWTHNPKDHTAFWPDWVADDALCSTWVVDMDANLSGWSASAMPLVDQALEFSAQIRALLGPRQKPVVLVGHSYGGLVIKSALVQAATGHDKAQRELLDMLAGVVFVGTPHQGATLASLAAGIASCLLRTNPHVKDMKADEHNLRLLQDQFLRVQNDKQFPVLAFAEGKGMHLGEKWPIFGRLNLRWRVVDRNSSNPYVFGVTPTPTSEDHSSIAKPKSPGATVHTNLVRFLKQQATALEDSENVEQTNAQARRGPRVTQPQPTDSPIQPKDVHLAYAKHLGAQVVTSVVIVSDSSDALSARFREIRAGLARSPLVPQALREQTMEMPMVAIAQNAFLRGMFLKDLATVPLSIYVSYVPTPRYREWDQARQDEKLLAEPLADRLMKKSTRVEVIRSKEHGLERHIKAAVATASSVLRRPIQTPRTFGPASSDVLLELAQFVACAVSEHLASPDDPEAAALFWSIATRIRYAQNADTGEKHLRDNNPLQ